MASGNVGPAGVSVYTPTAKELYTKVGKVEVADAAVAFQAFGIPQGALIAGVYTISMGANATQTINAGFTSGGTDLLNAAGVNSTGYAAAGSAAGSAVGTVLSADKMVWLKASATVTNPVYVKVEYYIPQSGQAW